MITKPITLFEEERNKGVLRFIGLMAFPYYINKHGAPWVCEEYWLPACALNCNLIKVISYTYNYILSCKIG